MGKNKMTFHKPQKYLVVCRTQRQANDLWRRLADYWDKFEGHTFNIRRTQQPLMVEAPFKGDSVRFISVRSASYIAEIKGFRGKIVYGEDVDKWLDEKDEISFNTKINKETR